MTEAQVLTVTAALRTAGVEHRVWLNGPNDWYVVASPTTTYTADQMNAFETTHGVTASTNRALFT